MGTQPLGQSKSLGHVLLARGDLAGALTEMQRESDEESRLAGIAAQALGYTGLNGGPCRDRTTTN